MHCNYYYFIFKNSGNTKGAGNYPLILWSPLESMWSPIDHQLLHLTVISDFRLLKYSFQWIKTRSSDSWKKYAAIDLTNAFRLFYWYLCLLYLLLIFLSNFVQDTELIPQNCMFQAQEKRRQGDDWLLIYFQQNLFSFLLKVPTGDKIESQKCSLAERRLDVDSGWLCLVFVLLVTYMISV